MDFSKYAPSSGTGFCWYSADQTRACPVDTSERLSRSISSVG